MTDANNERKFGKHQLLRKFNSIQIIQSSSIQIKTKPKILDLPFYWRKKKKKKKKNLLNVNYSFVTTKLSWNFVSVLIVRDE